MSPVDNADGGAGVLHVSPAPVDPCTDSPITHWTCCEDMDIGLCGKDLSAVEVVDDDVPITCVVCNDLNSEAPTFCPKHPFCRVYSVPV